MKKIVLFLCCLLLVGTLTACGSKAVNEKQITEDIKTCEELVALNVEVTDWEIIKRQTDEENKTDLIYCKVNAKNDDYSVVRSYVMKYTLYNDGWVLDYIENYDGLDASSETVPLRGVSHEQVLKDIAKINAAEYASAEYAIVNFNFAPQENLQTGNYLSVEEGGRCIVEINAMYEYPLWIENVVIPLEYQFLPQMDGSYGWNGMLRYTEAERFAEFTENIIGKFVKPYDGWRIYGYTEKTEVEIISCDKNTCVVNYYIEDCDGNVFQETQKQATLEGVLYKDEIDYLRFYLTDKIYVYITTGNSVDQLDLRPTPQYYNNTFLIRQ